MNLACLWIWRRFQLPRNSKMQSNRSPLSNNRSARPSGALPPSAGPPQAQHFCRGMQLESTLFGVVVIQIQPQLEKLLHIGANRSSNPHYCPLTRLHTGVYIESVCCSLAKEIQLTEHLMELFIKYHIPVDLLCFQEADQEVCEISSMWRCLLNQ